MNDAQFEAVCASIIETVQTYIETLDGPYREAMLTRLRELGLRPEHIANVVQVAEEVERSTAVLH